MQSPNSLLGQFIQADNFLSCKFDLPLAARFVVLGAYDVLWPHLCDHDVVRKLATRFPTFIDTCDNHAGISGFYSEEWLRLYLLANRYGLEGVVRVGLKSLLDYSYIRQLGEDDPDCRYFTTSPALIELLSKAAFLETFKKYS